MSESESAKPAPNTPPRPEPLLRWFKFAHLPEGKPRDVSAAFADLARRLTLPSDPLFVDGSAERTVALRKLLEGKDAAVRAAVRAALPPET